MQVRTSLLVCLCLSLVILGALTSEATADVSFDFTVDDTTQTTRGGEGTKFHLEIDWHATTWVRIWKPPKDPKLQERNSRKETEKTRSCNIYI